MEAMNKTKEVTIYDIAEQLSISVATVSRALQDDPVVTKKTKKRVFDLAEKLGYRSNHFARSLRKQRTETIGVIVPRLNSYFMSTVIAGIENIANSHGYNLIITQSSESVKKEMAAARTLFDSRVDGLLVSLAYDTEDISHFEKFHQKQLPVIFFDRGEAQKKFTSVEIDNYQAAYIATQHLIKQGRKKIVHITAYSQRSVYADRLRGFKQALKENDIGFTEKNIFRNNLTQEAGVAVAMELLQRKKEALPDAVFAANDNAAVGCLLYLKQEGIKIPDDIAIVGFNNDPISTIVEPHLTTINYPGYEMGQTAARHLINHLNGISHVFATHKIILNSGLIIRASSQLNS